MIEISYYDDTKNDVMNARCNVCIDDSEATLSEVVSGLIKVAKFAGYSSLSFDNIVTEYVRDMLEEKENKYTQLTSKDVKVDKDYTFEDFITDRVFG